MLAGLALATIGAQVSSWAAPIRSPLRSAPPEQEQIEPDFVQRRGPGDRWDLCGTRPNGLVQLLHEHHSRRLPEVHATPHSTDAGEIAVIEDDGTFFYTVGTTPPYTKVDAVRVCRAFYQTHGDDYDFLAVFLSSGLNDFLGSPGAFASAVVVRNQIQGIGLDTFDFAGEFGSPSRLQTILNMNGLHRYPSDPFENIEGSENHSLDALGHEMGHRWLAYVQVDSAGESVAALLGRGRSHWNFFFDAGPSIMEGCDWVALPSDSFTTVGVSLDFGIVDEYLMGLRTKSETGPFFVVNEPTDENPPGTYIPTSIPFVGFGCDGRATTWTVDDIEAAEGVRVPPGETAPRDFRIGVILVTAQGQGATPADLAKLDTLRTRFVPYFETITHGRGTVDLSLDSQAGEVRIVHGKLPDAEVAASRPIGCRANIDPGGIPISIDPASVKAFWRVAGGGSYTPLAMTPAGGDSFAATLPAMGGPQEYYLYASSDSAGIEAFDPPGGAATPYTFTVAPDLTPPSVIHVPVPKQGDGRMPQHFLARITDNLGVESVSFEYSVNGGSVQSVVPTAAGRDSFLAAPGGYQGPGTTFAYRFVARDASAAENIGYSNAAFEMLLVEPNWYDDFENGTYGYSHASATVPYRDAWHPTSEDSSPTGGTSVKCGGGPGEPYPPYLDAALQMPFIFGLQPGTVLKFDHRYDLEQDTPTRAWDGARVEGRIGSGPWMPLQTDIGYTHTFRSLGSPMGQDTPCWSGTSPGWRTEIVDLSPLAPGPSVVRFRMATDSYVSGQGWFVDKIRLVRPGAVDVPIELPTGALAGRPWPNPTSRFLRQTITLPQRAQADWSLYDVTGRRVATLWRGAIPAAGFELSAELPKGLGAGLYFVRVLSGGRELASGRIAVVR